MELGEYYRARDILEELLRKDLYGPVAEDEVICDTWPDDYYICGRLFPQGTPVSGEETEKNQICDDIEGYELPMNLCYSSRPSSMAISFTVRPGVKKLRGEASFAWYVPEEPKKWRRHAKTVPFEIAIDPAQPYQEATLHEGLELRVYLHRSYSNGARTVTVAMVNTSKAKMDRNSNCASTFFQPRIVIRGETDNQAPFMQKKPRIKLNQDPELLNLEMLYRHNPTFAIGHGCSVDWKTAGDYATEIYTEFIPACEVRQMEPACYVRAEILTFRFLGNGSLQEVCAGLQEMADSYRQWITGQEALIDELPERYRSSAETNMLNCHESLRRIRAGIELLATDSLVWQAFQLMNRAMLYQRRQTAGHHLPDTEPGWYPFQLAFILQEISSIARPGDPFREVVDLLWFPTGGGKTEAYLGLAAFTIFLRRLRAVREKRSGGGVTIIMRYTLRLLTLQQFERAAALICACELIRRENPGLLGETEIAAGLWVGGGLTPNSRDEARSILNKIRTTSKGFDSLTEDEPNPCQVLTCPWCKTEIKPQHYEVNSNGMIIFCPQEECPFHRGLPVYIVDEDIYQKGPALVVSTVDKYARMTWQPEVGKLFGLGTEWLPPELIIQDELHLISGPLGTIAGLYEVAVNELCQYKGIKAKIISSTATIRNAAGQIRSLYGRDCRQFPAQGLDIRDSYFAREAGKMDKPARRYLGILAPGTSGNTLLIRVYSVLLMARSYLKRQGFSNEVIDSFWTLTGYFNTLKQLGGAVVNIYDDVMGRLKYLYRTKFRMLFSGEVHPPDYLEIDELTSRKKSSEIAGVLKRLEICYSEPDVYDVILASSMLSVGVDIGRLGLMVVQGQPKSNSEYIQATSRVGRRTPGLVVTMYDASRSRDRSHYEQFRAYHASLYRYVEATSLTPFAERARDRALHAVLISLCRHLIPGLRSNGDAGQVGAFRSRVEEIINKIADRVNQVDPPEVEDTRRELYEILDRWEQLAGSNLVYQKYGKQEGIPLLTHRFDSDGHAFPTLNSMRDVDVECEVFLEG
ncbi:MAG: hypothetical protein PWP72_142 [Thermoanaerobacter sp.]|nr:hypothetical protein [Thermoanaerobacter sp.]